MAGRLRENLRLNHLFDVVEIMEVAVGSSSDSGYLQLVKQNYGQSSVVSEESKETIPIDVCPLVQYLPSDTAQYQIFVLKIDVEGFEDEVLIPFFETSSWDDIPDAILVETDHAELWSADLVGYLKQKGYVPLFEGEDQNTLFIRGTYAISRDI